MVRFYGEEFSAPSPTPKLEDRTLSTFRYYLLNIFPTTHRIGGRSSNRNLRTRHAMAAGTHLPWLDSCQHNLRTRHAMAAGTHLPWLDSCQHNRHTQSFYPNTWQSSWLRNANIARMSKHIFNTLRTGSIRLFKRPFQAFLTILTL
jgi:hypothetical protein